MTMYSVEAIDPLVFRDGRPNDGRSESRTLGFPLPSVLVGAVRTAIGRRGGNAFDSSLVGALVRRVRLRGPLLGSKATWYVPAPGDALLFAEEAPRKNEGESGPSGLSLRALVPITAPAGATSPTGAGRHLVGFAKDALPKAKPLARPPAFWSWRAFATWLRAPGKLDDTACRDLLRDAIDECDREDRVHVAVGPTGTAEDGKLFGTDGLRFTAARFDPRSKGEREADAQVGRRGPAPVSLELRLEVDVDEADGPRLELPESGVRPIGGERRLSRWARSDATFPPMPPEVVEHAVGGDAAVVRVILLTPAYVDSSLGPRSLEEPGVSAIIAARVGRPVTMSGWDLTKPHGGAPKATRRLAAAGSVYWVRLSGNADARRLWLDKVWMQNIGDDPALTRDGFGLAAIGIGSEP